MGEKLERGVAIAIKHQLRQLCDVSPHHCDEKRVTITLAEFPITDISFGQLNFFCPFGSSKKTGTLTA